MPGDSDMFQVVGHVEVVGAAPLVVLGGVHELHARRRCRAAAARRRRCWSPPRSGPCWSRISKAKGSPAALRSVAACTVQPASSSRLGPRAHVGAVALACRPTRAARSPRARRAAGRLRRLEQLAHPPLGRARRPSPGGSWRSSWRAAGRRPPFSVWLTNSKLKACIIASRTRQSAKSGRRVLITKPSMPEGRPCGISDFTTAPVVTAGKS